MIATAAAANTLDEPPPRPTALDELPPRTPHLEMTEEELDELYPRLRAPPEEPLCDVACDGDDHVYQRGLQIAEALQEDTEENGRRRHAAEGAAQQREGALRDQDQASQQRRVARPSRPTCSSSATTTSGPARSAKQASGAAVAKRHDRRRSASGSPASGITSGSSRAWSERSSEQTTRRTLTLGTSDGSVLS